jgi:predicted kinase
MSNTAGDSEVPAPVRDARLALQKIREAQAGADYARIQRVLAARAPVGSKHTKLIVIRGNSGSGKSTIVRQLQLRHGPGCALVEQDYLRRIVLRERDTPGGLAPDLIAHTVRFALDRGLNVILEGILYSAKYGDMVRSLIQAHRGQTSVFYLDVSLAETLRRHEGRLQVADFTRDDMRGWYIGRDVLSVDGEHVVPEATSLEEATSLIASSAGLPLLMSA